MGDYQCFCGLLQATVLVEIQKEVGLPSPLRRKKSGLTDCFLKDEARIFNTPLQKSKIRRVNRELSMLGSCLPLQYLISGFRFYSSHVERGSVI